MLLQAVEQAFRQQFLLRMRQENIDLFPGAAPLILHLGDEDGLTMSELGKRCLPGELDHDAAGR